MWQGLLIIRIIGGISRGTYGMVTRNRAISMAERADEEEEEE
jgi:hypothetical protein